MTDAGKTDAGKTEAGKTEERRDELWDKGLATRRAVVGDDYVDRSLATMDGFNDALAVDVVLIAIDHLLDGTGVAVDDDEGGRRAGVAVDRALRAPGIGCGEGDSHDVPPRLAGRPLPGSDGADEV